MKLLNFCCEMFCGIWWWGVVIVFWRIVVVGCCVWCMWYFFVERWFIWLMVLLGWVGIFWIIWFKEWCVMLIWFCVMLYLIKMFGMVIMDVCCLVRIWLICWYNIEFVGIELWLSCFILKLVCESKIYIFCVLCMCFWIVIELLI